MNETIPDKEAYQTNRRRMCWAALGMTIACTIATIYDPVRMSEADGSVPSIVGSGRRLLCAGWEELINEVELE